MVPSVHTPPDDLMQVALPTLPMLKLEFGRDLVGSRRDGQIMRVLNVQSPAAGFQDVRASFAVVYKPNWTSQSFETAIRQHQSAALSGPVLPLVMLPYLDEEKLEILADRQISGLDLCGNALLIIPGRLLVQRSGQPNRFRVERGLKSPYTGKASLVGRALLVQPHFKTANALLEFIRAQQGDLSQALVSRTLKALTDDLVVSGGNGQAIEVLQPEKLLDRLVEGWLTSAGGIAGREQRLLWRGRVPLPDMKGSDYVLRSILNVQAGQQRQRLVMTGLSSASTWTNLSSGDLHAVYVDAVGDLLVGLNAEETRRFPNLELWRPPDEAVYFDARHDADGGRWASQVQTYLEMVNGDARTQAAAVALRASILGQLRSWGEAGLSDGEWS